MGFQQFPRCRLGIATMHKICLVGVRSIVCALLPWGIVILPPMAEVPACCITDGSVAPEFLMAGLLGVPLVALHCAGMCGPLIMAFRFGTHGDEGTHRTLRASTQLLSYQAGRMVLYASFGALVGAAGMGLKNTLQSTASWLAFAVAAAFLFAGVNALVPIIRRKQSGDHPPTPGPLAKATRWTLSTFRNWPHVRAMFLGAVMAFLPCGLPFAALAMAATRGNPIDGAFLMVLLVVLTTPILLVMAIAPVVSQRMQAFLKDRFSPWAMIISGVWMSLIALAAGGFIEHQMIDLGNGRVIMFY